MKSKTLAILTIIALCLSLASALAPPLASPAQAAGRIIKLTNNSYDDGEMHGGPQIDAGQVTWAGYDGHDWEIFLYDGTNTVQLTNNYYDDDFPKISAGQVVWKGYDGNEGGIFLYDGNNIVQLASNGNLPVISDGQVAWVGSDGNDAEIFLYDGTSTIQLTNNDYDDSRPQIDAGQVTWLGRNGNDWEVFLYDGSTIIQVTNNDYLDTEPQIDAGQLTWWAQAWTPGEYDTEIFFYDGSNVIRLTNNNYDDLSPQINAGEVAWNGSDGNDLEIFLYSGGNTVQLTNNDYNDGGAVQIDAGQVTWVGLVGNDYANDWEIFLYDGSDILRLTNNDYNDTEQQIDSGYVTWEEWDGNDYEIYLYDPYTTDEVVTFPDPNLAAAIRQTIGKPTGDIYQSDLEWLTTLNAGNRSITNLTGLECCTSLTYLDLPFNQISDLSPISGLSSLTWLQLSSNPINDFTPISGLTNLTFLNLYGCGVTDVSTFSDLHSLTGLMLANNRISNFSPILDLTNLNSLDLSSTGISDILELLSLSNLVWLGLNRNPLNAATYDYYIPQLQARGVSVYYPEPNTLPGSIVVVDPLAPYVSGIATVTFDYVSAKGYTMLGPYPKELPNLLPTPPGYRVLGDPIEITTGAEYSGNVEVALRYNVTPPPPDSTPVEITNENGLKLFHWEGGMWKDVTTSVDTENDIMYGRVISLGAFFVGEFTGGQPPAPPTVTTNQASNVFGSSAIMHGYLDSKGTASSVNVSFQWATEEDYDAMNGNYTDETSPLWPMTSTGAFSYSLTGLSPDTTYHFRAKAVGDGTAYGNDLSFTTAGPGSDGDGVPANIEDAAPNNGDGNNDSIPDSQQSNVASLPNATNGQYATIESPSGTSLSNVSAVNVNSLPTEGKPNLVFPYGLFSFDISGVPVGGTVWVTLRFASPVPAGSEYWKYGPTPGNPTPHWYQIAMNSNDGDNVIEIPLVDGGLGDDDLTANTVIIDQGGPGWPPPPGGGGAAGVPVFPNIYIGIGAALGAGAVGYLLRRRVIHRQ